MLYGLAASILPVWMLLTPRDYLSTFLKLGTVAALAVAVVVLRPTLLMPSISRFIDGSGPVFAGPVFPFVCITIACGAVSGFHSLIASGTTPKMIEREARIRDIGYGAMVTEMMVALDGDDRRLRPATGRIFRHQHKRRADRSGRENQRRRVSGHGTGNDSACCRSRARRRCSAGPEVRRLLLSAWRTCFRASLRARPRWRFGITSRSCSKRFLS